MPISKALRYGPCVTMVSHSLTCHPHTDHTCLYSPAARRHRPLTGTHCAYRRRDGQAELIHTHSLTPLTPLRWFRMIHLWNKCSDTCQRRFDVTVSVADAVCWKALVFVQMEADQASSMRPKSVTLITRLMEVTKLTSSEVSWRTSSGWVKRNDMMWSSNCVQPVRWRWRSSTATSRPSFVRPVQTLRRVCLSIVVVCPRWALTDILFSSHSVCCVASRSISPTHRVPGVGTKY